MMRKLMAANWKMYKTTAEAGDTASQLVSLVSGKLPDTREVLVIPPFTALDAVGKAFSGAKGFFLGGQNFYPREEGAFTGEISVNMLRDKGCAYALAGHSERRHILGETDELVGEKVAFGLHNGLRMILCIGETIEERKGGHVRDVLARQLAKGLAGVHEYDFAPADLSVAYEPIWAIGTGEVAGPEEIVEAHTFLRSALSQTLGSKAEEMRILYGGSVKPGNASEIISLDNVDGVLVGGASLGAESFRNIVLA